MGLIVFDLDGVLINEYLPELAKLVDKEKEVSEITQLGIMEKIDWKDGLEKRIALLQGLSIEDATRVATKMEYHEGIVETFRQLKENGHILAVITGGFDVFEERLRNDLGIDFVIANKFIVDNGRINGIEIIVDEHKEKSLEKLLYDLEIDKKDVIMVGDGTNDIGILRSAGYAVGLNPEHEVKPFIDCAIKNIRELIPIVNKLARTAINNTNPTNKLFVPGPVDVSPDVIAQMNKPMIYHRGKEFSELLANCVDKLKRLAYTENNVFISTSSSTGLMEAAIRNCVKNRCLNIATGAFGERWHKIALVNGKQADLLKIEWGKAVTPDLVDEKLSDGEYDSVTLVHNETSTGVSNPIYEISNVLKKYDVCFLVDTVSSMGGIKIEVDKLGIDVCLFGSQKALSLPPGLSACSVSEKAMKMAETVPNRGYYFDFLVFQKYWLKRQTPATPAIPQMNAMNYQLDRIFNEGLEERYKRHREMGESTRKWVKNNFELFADEKYASNTLTCIRNSRNVDVEDMISDLNKRGYVIANGYGKLSGKTFRIAHMGDRTIDDLKNLLNNIDEFLVSI